ncbi:MAG: hypothetical protein LBL98_06445 [Ruminococcus sp.]|jgi:hypothetical protein|nr:hypothetical protein [Ruminococcus sp.]
MSKNLTQSDKKFKKELKKLEKLNLSRTSGIFLTHKIHTIDARGDKMNSVINASHSPTDRIAYLTTVVEELFKKPKSIMVRYYLWRFDQDMLVNYNGKYVTVAEIDQIMSEETPVEGETLTEEEVAVKFKENLEKLKELQFTHDVLYGSSDFDTIVALAKEMNSAIKASRSPSDRIAYLTEVVDELFTKPNWTTAVWYLIHLNRDMLANLNGKYVTVEEIRRMTKEEIKQIADVKIKQKADVKIKQKADVKIKQPPPPKQDKKPDKKQLKLEENRKKAAQKIS